MWGAEPRACAEGWLDRCEVGDVEREAVVVGGGVGGRCRCRRVRRR